MNQLTGLVDSVVGGFMLIIKFVFLGFCSLAWIIILTPLKFFGWSAVADWDWQVIWMPGAVTVGIVLALLAIGLLLLAVVYAVFFVCLGVFLALKYICLGVLLALKYTCLGIWYVIKTCAIEVFQLSCKIIQCVFCLIQFMALYSFDKCCGMVR